METTVADDPGEGWAAPVPGGTGHWSGKPQECRLTRHRLNPAPQGEERVNRLWAYDKRPAPSGARGVEPWAGVVRVRRGRLAERPARGRWHGLRAHLGPGRA